MDIIGVAVVVAVALIIFFVVKKARDKRASGGDSVSGRTGRVSGDDDGSRHRDQ